MGHGAATLVRQYLSNSDRCRFCGDHHDDDHHVCLITNAVIVITKIILYVMFLKSMNFIQN